MIYEHVFSKLHLAPRPRLHCPTLHGHAPTLAAAATEGASSVAHRSRGEGGKGEQQREAAAPEGGHARDRGGGQRIKLLEPKRMEWEKFWFRCHGRVPNDLWHVEVDDWKFAHKQAWAAGAQSIASGTTSTQTHKGWPWNMQCTSIIVVVTWL